MAGVCWMLLGKVPRSFLRDTQGRGASSSSGHCGFCFGFWNGGGYLVISRGELWGQSCHTEDGKAQKGQETYASKSVRTSWARQSDGTIWSALWRSKGTTSRVSGEMPLGSQYLTYKGYINCFRHIFFRKDFWIWRGPTFCHPKMCLWDIDV